jgi:hypothetical protein
MFAEAVCRDHHVHHLAYVRDYMGVDLDRIKCVASFSGEGRRRWIRIARIESLFGILKEGGVNLIMLSYYYYLFVSNLLYHKSSVL